MNCEIYECQKCRGYSSLVYKLPAVIVCSDCHSKPSPEQARIAHLEQQAARLANLPGLPNGWRSPFYIEECFDIGDTLPAYLVLTGDRHRRSKQLCAYTTSIKETAEFYCSLLNACYPPAPGQEGGK